MSSRANAAMTVIELLYLVPVHRRGYIDHEHARASGFGVFGELYLVRHEFDRHAFYITHTVFRAVYTAQDTLTDSLEYRINRSQSVWL